MLLHDGPCMLCLQAFTYTRITSLPRASAEHRPDDLMMTRPAAISHDGDAVHSALRFIIGNKWFKAHWTVIVSANRLQRTAVTGRSVNNKEALNTFDYLANMSDATDATADNNSSSSAPTRIHDKSKKRSIPALKPPNNNLGEDAPMNLIHWAWYEHQKARQPWWKRESQRPISQS